MVLAKSYYKIYVYLVTETHMGLSELFHVVSC